MISNLLSKAIKYSNKDKVIKIETKNDDKKIKLSITERWIDIPEEKQLHIFDLFSRVHEQSQNYSGLGILSYPEFDTILS